MRALIVSLVLSCALSGCLTSPKGATKSSWKPLKKARNIECFDFPKLIEGVKIGRVHLFQNLGPSLFIESINRRGEAALYHLAFKEVENISDENAKSLKIYKGGQFLGAGLLGENAYYATSNFMEDRNLIEVRDLFTDQVILKDSIKSQGNFEVVDWAYGRDAINALVREEKIDEALEDQPAILLSIDLGNPSEFLSISRDERKRGDLRMTTTKDGNHFIFWLDRGTSDSIDPKPKLRASKWHMKKSNDEQPIELDASDVEKWALVNETDGIAVVAVKGDTLLWSNPRIEKRFFDAMSFGFQDKLASKALDKVHIGAPMLLNVDGKIIAFFQEWLDHESTLVAYEVSDGEFKSLGNYGVFPEKEVIEKVFYHEVSNEILMIKKGEYQHLEKRSICSIKI